MTELGMHRRLSLLVPQQRAALWLPLDDSLISGPEEGLLHPAALLVPEVVEHLTAILGFRGTFTACKREIGNVPIIMNLSASTVRGEHTHKVLTGNAIDAVRAGAQAIAYHVNHSSPFEADALRELGRLASEADSFGIPLVAIAYPRGRTTEGKDYNYLDLREVDEDAFAQLVRHCVRLAVELGASAVKTVYTGSVESFRTVVSAALGVPVLIAGEGLMDSEKAMARGKEAVHAGAAGVAYGRQIFKRRDPQAFVHSLRLALDDEWKVRLGHGLRAGAHVAIPPA